MAEAMDTETETSLSTETETSLSESEAAAPSGPSRTVIVAMDMSDFCRDAFYYYMKYLRRPTDYLILQHIPEHVAIMSSTLVLFQEPHLVKDLLRQENTRSFAYLEDIEILLQEHGKNGRIECTRGAHPGQEICQLAESTKASLLVLAARGMGIHRKTNLGKVADYILHHSPVPAVIFRSSRIQQFCST